ncbi:MAG: hypothetical protein IJS12_02325 [Lachnospiraceae bacterium]|nr:hypothetical protein [Lachnospiraceae bacterium]
MRNRVIENDLFYFDFDDFSHVMRHTVSLKCGDISGDVLNNAVQRAALRYPYFCIRILRHGESYEIIHNPDPIPVRPGTAPILLGGDEADGHLIAVSYVNNKIIFDISHNLTDSKGFLPWIQTVIYLYLTDALGIHLSSAGIRLPGEDFLPGEAEDPYEHMELDDVDPVPLPKDPECVFVPDMRYASGTERSDYVFTVSVDDLMRLAGSQDGSPASVLAYFSKEMIRELFPDSRGTPISCSMPYSFRPIACGENNYHPQTVLLNIIYDDRYDSMPMDRQLTCTRGTVIARSDPDSVRYRLSRYAGFVNSLDDLPTIAERRSRYHERLESIVSETFAVSYIGRTNWGSIEAYMDGIMIESAAISAPIMFLMVPVGDKFHATMMLNQTSDVYVETLVRILNDHGISSEYLYTCKQELCKVHMP